MDEPLTPAASRWSYPFRVAATAVVAALLGLLAWTTLTASAGGGVPARVAAGEYPAAPGFSLPVLWPRAETWPASARRTLADGQVELAELQGRPLVINFWASWCIPCREEAPLLNAAARAHAGEVIFLGLNIQDLTRDGIAFSREFQTPYVSVRDGRNETHQEYGLTGVPETYYLDARGRVVAHARGPVTSASLEAAIAAAREGGHE